MIKKTIEQFISEAAKIHNNKYNYNKSIYVNNITDLIITCPMHGDFIKKPNKHINQKQGCPECAKLKQSKIQRKTNEQFIREASKIHNNKYDYSLAKYVGNKTKIKIICPIHGIFEQTPDNHLSGRGCKYCGGTHKLDTKSFIFKSKKIHGDKYNYNKTNYINSHTEVIITCPIHGDFKILPTNHLSKNQGCLRCSGRIYDNESFKKRAKEIHGDKYLYPKNYDGKHRPLKIKCKTHGEFIKTPYQHIDQKQGCPKCDNKNTLESELKSFIKNLSINIIENDRDNLNGLELDVFIPYHNIAIEFDGLYFHSEIFKDSTYHLNKTELCEKQNIQLIHVFEDEWVFKKDIVKSRLKNILGLTENKIYGRKTIIKEVKTKEARQFFEKNHLQGYANSKIKLGLYYDNELVSCMTFGNNRPILKTTPEKDKFELIRFANKLNTNVIGGASKLFSYFKKTYKPITIITYADRRWSTGNLYENLGFKFIKDTEVGYFYVKNKIRESRFKYQKHKIFDIYGENYKEGLFNDGIFKIYDCGNKKYIYN